MWKGVIVKVEGLLHSFDVSCQTRQFTRRRLLRFIRLNAHLLKDHQFYGWIMKKVDRNYMTDITDSDVINFVTWITKKTGGQVEHTQSVL
jgi:hypothetical protein